MNKPVSYRVHRKARTMRARAMHLLARRAIRALRIWLGQFGEIGLVQHSTDVRPLPVVDR
jgi:hypothetical protein